MIKKIKCPECDSSILMAELRSNCLVCEYNGYLLSLSEGLWGYDENKRRGKEREQVELQSKCKIGPSDGVGCMLFKCTSCHKMFNFHFTGEC